MKRSLLAALVVLGLAFPAFADSWKVDAIHTTVLFKVQHFGAGRFIGRFNAAEGKIAWDDQDPTKSSIEVTVKADSVDTASADRDKHLKSPDFFNTKQYPTITFKSTKLEKSDKGFNVTGDLTLHGETHPVTAAMEITGKGKGMKGEERIGAEATFKIKRTEFGMKGMVGPVGDDVELTVGIEAIKE
jgi:polyisoprenoid-binding protein YceI